MIPVMFDDTKEELEDSLRVLNGILLTGGGSDIADHETNLLTQYGQAVKTILDHSQREMQAGRFFPVWGTCLGYEAIQVVLTNNTKSLGHSNARYVNLKLSFTENAKTSRLFKDLNPELASAV